MPQVKKQILRGALIGCGNISKIQLEAWQRISGVKIAALVDVDLKRAVNRADQFHIPRENTYKTIEELLAAQRVDFIDLATPPSAHLPQVKLAIENKIPVLCQKPFANTVEEAEKMLAICEEHNVILSINENWRWREWYQVIKKKLQQGVIGEPNYFSFRSHHNFTLPVRENELPELFIRQPYTRKMKKLLVFEFGIHIVDVARFLFGELVGVFARMQKISTLCEGEDKAMIFLDHSHLSGLMDLSWSSMQNKTDDCHLEDFIVDGSKGRIIVNAESRTLSIATADTTECIDLENCCGQEAYLESFIRAQSHFIEKMIKQQKPQTHAGDNIKTLRTVFAIYQSAESGHYIKC